MSGRKKGFVGVDRAVLDAFRKRVVERNKQAPLILHLDDTGLAAVEAEFDRAQGRQTTLETALVDCSADLQTLEAQTSEQICSLQQGFATQMAARETEIQTAFQGITEHIYDIQSDLETHREKVEYLGEAVHGIEAREEALFCEAASWLDGAAKLLEFIDAVYAHETFSPGVITDADGRLSRAELAYQRGAAEAAYVLAESVYYDLSKMRIYLEIQSTRWQALHQAARTQADALYERAMSSRQLNAWDLEGNELDIMVDADYWSQRQLGRQSSRLAKLASELTHNTTEMLDPVWLEQLVAETLPQMQTQLDQTLTEARMAALEAQLRANIAERVIEALEGQGYQVAGENLPEDIRKGCRMKMINLDGSSVEVVVAAVPGSSGQSELSLLSEDADRKSPHELDRRAIEVSQALSGTGLVVGGLGADDSSSQAPLPSRRINADLKVRQPVGAHLVEE
jgi:hypothetical protein